MTTIAIVSQKGGSGKTTLALNLATAAVYAGRSSCVIDADPQATAAAWGDWRGEFLPEVITCPPVRLFSTVDRAKRGGAEIVVIDTPPHGETASREAVRVADLVLVPTRARAFDLHSLEGTSALMGYASKPAYVVFNAVPSRASRMLEQAAEAARNLSLEVCPVHFGERAAYHRASGSGEVAQEAEPDGKAAGEVQALWQWVVQHLGI